VQGTALLGIWLELCREHGIDEVLINAHAHSEAVMKYAAEHHRGLSIRVFEEKTLLGSAGTLRENRAWAGQDPEFWILYGDVLTCANLTRMLEFHRRLRLPATIGVYEVTNPQQCGIVTPDERGIVRDFVEKPAHPRGHLAFAGLMIATPAIFDLVPQETPADIGFHVLPKLVGKMAACSIPEFLVDIGTPEKYAMVQETWPGLHAKINPGGRA
ncbi:MAG: nucleotidyltransferase family protein, partial [Candidatus Acidiferrales bacterium]